MSFEDIKNIIPKSEPNLKLLDIKLLNTESKSYLFYQKEPNSILIRMDNLIHLESVNFIEFINNKYKDEFITPQKMENYDDNIYVFFNIEKCEFLNFNNPLLNEISLTLKLSLFREYISIICLLLLLKEDMSLFDAKLLYFFKEKKENKTRLKIKYLYTGKY